MSASNNNQTTRRDIIKSTLARIGGLIGALVRIPSVVCLLSPALQAWAEDEAVVLVGTLDKFVIKIENGNLFVLLPPLRKRSV